MKKECDQTIQNSKFKGGLAPKGALRKRPAVLTKTNKERNNFEINNWGRIYLYPKKGRILKAPFFRGASVLRRAAPCGASAVGGFPDLRRLALGLASLWRLRRVAPVVAPGVVGGSLLRKSYIRSPLYARMKNYDELLKPQKEFRELFEFGHYQ